MKITKVLRGYAEQHERFLRKQEMRRDVRQHKERHMSTPETTESENHLPIRFDGGDGANDRLLQGTIIRCVDGHWSDRDGVAFSPDTQMIVLGTTQALQRWQDQTPIETILKKPGERLPDVKALNAAIPQSEWEDGIDGNPRPPWVLQHVVYLLNPVDASLYTYLNSTTGAAIAVKHLNDRVKWMRALRSEQVVPLVALDAKPMATRYGQKMRPEFRILGWREFGVGLAHQAAPQLEHAGGLKPVKPVTTEEELDDKIRF
jgi:hypothetical protein